MECPNCSTPHGPDDIFCENCGLDFLTGTLPEAPEPPPTGVDPLGQSGPAAALSDDVALVRIDPAFFERMRFEGVEVPEVLPAPIEVRLPTSDVLIGRRSTSRGVHPEVDLRGLFDDAVADPAVSTTHARLRRTASGWSITDLGSTNGTYLGESTEEIQRGVPVPVPAGTPIFVGAWTRLDLTTLDRAAADPVGADGEPQPPAVPPAG